MWQQSDNVPFEQSRNVPLTVPDFRNAGRTAIDDAGGKRPAGDLVTLKKAKKRLITQGQAAGELDLSVRQVKRLLCALKKRGDQAVVHGLRGKPSNRRIEPSVESRAVSILSMPVYHGFGPSLAAEYLVKKHGIEASKETVRQWMIRGKLWRAEKEKVRQVHIWRPRRSGFGELVQWDTSDHDWLEGRSEKLRLIAMIDDATSRLWARFVRHDSTEENMKLLGRYGTKFGRPLTFYTDKASHFHTTEKRRRDEPGVDQDLLEMPPTQIGRALREMGISWMAVTMRIARSARATTRRLRSATWKSGRSATITPSGGQGGFIRSSPAR
jgi:hypothetical protein